jgi:hypothetical protein
LNATSRYCGGVAISYNENVVNLKHALYLLKQCLTKISLHIIISDNKSVDEFIKLYDRYYKEVDNFTLLPLVKGGRSACEFEELTFDYLQSKILKFLNYSNISFGARMYEYLKKSNIKCSLYPPEHFSANALLQPNRVVITPSSFDLTPVKIIEL